MPARNNPDVLSLVRRTTLSAQTVGVVYCPIRHAAEHPEAATGAGVHVCQYTHHTLSSERALEVKEC